MSCIFFNSVGVRCPRDIYVEGRPCSQVCLHHACDMCGQLTVVPGYCAQHVPVVPDLPSDEEVDPVDPLDPNQMCGFISSKGRHCHHETDGSPYCSTHRCTYGQKTFRGWAHCDQVVVEGKLYCQAHQSTCSCYYTGEYRDGSPICNEDARPCHIRH